MRREETTVSLKDLTIEAQSFVRDVRRELSSQDIEDLFDELCSVVGRYPSTYIEEGRPLHTLIKICKVMSNKLEDF